MTNFSFSFNEGLPVKAFLSMTPCFFFLYVNVVMLFTLRSKEIFCETPRYILFSHLLASDSLLVATSVTFYIFYSTTLDEASLYILSYVCLLIYLLSGILNAISPLYLALMSLERYIAICFPLRHAAIADRRRTTVVVSVAWMLGLTVWLAELIASMIFEYQSPTRESVCSDYVVSQMSISFNINIAFTGIIFASASVIIIYTYIAVLVTAKSTTSDKTSASKAHRTILLHMVQFGLCLLSILFGLIRRSLATSKLSPVVVDILQYILYIGLNIFPRCLSPLIYGLRDKTFSASFKYYFLFCVNRKVQPSTHFI